MKVTIALLVMFLLAGVGSFWLLFSHKSGVFNSTIVTIAILLPGLALLIKKKSN